jgi:hypothetical protein
MIRNHRTMEGAMLGKEHARLYSTELAKRAKSGEMDERCATCAFRPGTVANGSPTTQMDVVKCIMEKVRFTCHHHGREGVICHGYELMKKPEGTPAKKMPWGFSDEPEVKEADKP